MNWQATSRRPIATADDLDHIKFIGLPEGVAPTHRARNQLAAGRTAVGDLLGEFNDPVNVAMSGTGRDVPMVAPQMHIHVVEVKDG